MTTITQADRDAAAAAQRDAIMRVGSPAQAFARHREQAEAETVAGIVAWLRNEALRAWGADATGRDETTFITAAIEAGEWKK